MSIFRYESEPFQFCSECRGQIADVEDCWRCDGSGVVEPYDPTGPRYVVRAYMSDAPSMDGLNFRVRTTLKELPPEVDI